MLLLAWYVWTARNSRLFANFYKDMSMPGDIAFDSGTSYWGANLTVAVLNGTVPQWRIDDMATRIMVRHPGSKD